MGVSSTRVGDHRGSARTVQHTISLFNIILTEAGPKCMMVWFLGGGDEKYKSFSREDFVDFCFQLLSTFSVSMSSDMCGNCFQPDSSLTRQKDIVEFCFQPFQYQSLVTGVW